MQSAMIRQEAVDGLCLEVIVHVQSAAVIQADCSVHGKSSSIYTQLEKC